MNDIGGEAAPGKEPHLASPVFARGRRLTKALLPDLQCPIEFGGLQCTERRLELFGRELVRLQLMPNAGKPKPLGSSAHQAADETFVGEQLF